MLRLKTMSKQGERVKKLRETLNLTQQEFAGIFGISRQFICDVEKNKKILNSEKLCILLGNYNANINWVLSGKGEMFLDENTEKSEEVLKKSVKSLLKEYGLIDEKD